MFLLFFVSLPKIKVLPPSGKSQKISLNLANFVPQPKPQPVAPPMPQPVLPPRLKPVIEKPVEETLKPISVVKKKLMKDESRTFVEAEEPKENNTSKPTLKKEQKKKIKKIKLAKKELKKKPVKKKVTSKHFVKRKHRRKRSRSHLANALMESGSSLYPSRSTPASSGSYTSRMINQLYGREFDTFSSSQKKFIKYNLGAIHRITQRTLTRNGYPEVAVRTRQQGTNVVSFYLHPNGDISNLRLKTMTGYTALDRNTLEVIRIAYKDYPLPNQKTKIVFYVQYSIY